MKSLRSGRNAKLPTVDSSTSDVPQDVAAVGSMVVMSSANRREFRNLPRLIRRAVCLVWEAGRRDFIITSAGGVAIGALVGVQLFLVRDVLALLLDTTGAVAFRDLVSPVLQLVTVLTLMRAGELLLRLRRDVLAHRVTRLASEQLLDVAESVDLAEFERPVFFDRLQQAKMSAMVRPTQVAEGIVSIAQQMFTMSGLVIALAAIQPVLVPLILIGGLSTALVQVRKARHNRQMLWEQIVRTRQRMYVEALLTGREEAKEVRAFGLGGELRKRYARLYDDATDAFLRIRRRAAVLDAVAAATFGIAVAGTFAILAYLLATGAVTPGVAGAAALAVQQFSLRARGVFGGVGSLYESAMFLEDFVSFADSRKAEASGEAPSAPASGFCQLTVEHVYFSYAGSRVPAVQDVSLELRMGEVVALVGENGSGKSTLAKLLSGLYPPVSGRVCWDGVDIQTFERGSVARNVAVIFQDFVRYQFTAYDNIALGDVERLSDAGGVQAAADQSGASTVVSGLPFGLQTMLSREFPGGQDISSGQWQKIALARAFFRQAPFVVFDEPTAALDPRSEYELFGELRRGLAGCAVLLISHRFSSVRMADRIYVMHGGRIVEHGTHDELMSVEGRYAELFRLQALAYSGGAT